MFYLHFPRSVATRLFHTRSKRVNILIYRQDKKEKEQTQTPKKKMRIVQLLHNVYNIPT